MKHIFTTLVPRYSLSIAAISVAFFTYERSTAQTAPAVPIAHAHNDYEHNRPLHDALKAGFASVEADVYLVNNQLLVAHDRHDTNPERSLESLYLAPLRQHFSQIPSTSAQKTFWLMIDVKSDPISTYKKIHSVLKSYPDLIAKIHESPQQHREPHHPPMRIVISGNRAKQEILDTLPLIAGIDGRLTDLQTELSPQAMPWISDNWRSHFTWRGESEFPPQERTKLRKFVKQAHEKGRLLRFWATPDSPKFWDELLNANVDLINADDLKGLNTHLQKRIRTKK
jgi:hypothetical protein